MKYQLISKTVNKYILSKNNILHVFCFHSAKKAVTNTVSINVQELGGKKAWRLW